MTTTSNKYSTSFGFTEEEVRNALQLFGLQDQADNVKNGTMVFALEIRVIFTIPGLLRNIWILGNLTAIGLIPAPIR